MNEENADVSEEATGPIGGERLRAARRDNDISVGDIAKELHLDEPKVRALERNEFDILGAPVFAKGHLRKYAELVGVPVDDIMADYYQMNRSVGAPPVVGPKRKQSSDIALGPWIGGAVAVIAIIAAVFWWVNRVQAPAASTVEPATLAPFSGREQTTPTEGGEVLPASDYEDEDLANAEEVVEEPAEEPVDTESAPTQFVAAPAPQSDAPQVSMDLNYSGDCWTEVSDASGRRLYYDLGRAGSVISLSGDAPLHVILGDSANVSITVDGRDYPIPASARNGRLARLDINRR